MEKVSTTTHVDRVWYHRLHGSKEKIRKILLDTLISQAIAQEISIDISSFAIEEFRDKQRGCEDNLRITATCNIIEDEEPKM